MRTEPKQPPARALRPSRIDGRPRFLAPLDVGGAVVVLLLDGCTAYVSTPSRYDFDDEGEPAVDLEALGTATVRGVALGYVSGHFRLNVDGSGDWAVDLDGFRPRLDVKRSTCGGDATPTGRAAVAESIARALRALAHANPGALARAGVASIRADLERARGKAREHVEALNRALDDGDGFARDLGRAVGAPATPTARVVLDDDSGRPLLDLDGARVGLRLGLYGGARLGVDFAGARSRLDGLDVSGYAVDSADDPKALLFGEPDLGRTVARALAFHVEALLGLLGGLRLAEGRAPGERLAVDRVAAEAFLALDGVAGDVLGRPVEPGVEVEVDRLGPAVRAARAFVVAADDLDAEPSGEHWGALNREGARLAEALRGAGRTGRRSRRLAQVAEQALAFVDADGFEALRAHSRALAEAVDPFAEVVES